MIYLFIGYFFIFGLMIGSFLNCLIWRLYSEEGMMNRSYCPKCRKQIAWYDNLPVLSYALLMGRCRHCKEDISCQYPIVEFAVGILFAMAFVFNFPLFLQDGFGLELFLTLFRDLYVICVMVVIFIYDMRWYLILDRVSLPACLIVLVLNLFIGFGWMNLLISAIIGSSFFLIQFLVSRGKWMGGGDIRLGLLMGIILGWPMVLVAIFIAYLIGGVVGIILMLMKQKSLGSQIPLGIFLTLATILTMFWGQNFLEWYLNFLYL